MGSGLVEVRHIRLEHPLELPLLNNQQMVEAFLPYTPQKAFTDRIASGSVIRGREQFDATGRRRYCLFRWWMIWPSLLTA
jgi:hypothetical protein